MSTNAFSGDARRSCDGACQGCILNYETQHHLERLDRHAALAVLSTTTTDALRLPEEYRIFGPGSRLEFEPLARAISRELQHGASEEVRLYLGGEVVEWDPAAWALKGQLLRWATERRRIRVFATRRAMDELPDEVLNPLVSLLEASSVELRVTESEDGSRLSAEVGGKSRSVRWASLQDSARTPGPGWGTAGDDRHVLYRSSEPLAAPLGVAVEASGLRRKPQGTTIPVEAGNELDGNIRTFGDRFWNLLIGRCSSLQAQFESGTPVSRLTYTDRYLRSPLTIRLLLEILSGLAARGVLRTRKTEVLVRTAELGFHRSGYSNYWFNDWSDEDTRSEVVTEALEVRCAQSRFAAEDKRDTPHYRELELGWEDGKTWRLRLDEGVGFLRATTRERFPFDQPTQKQAEVLEGGNLTVELRSRYPTCLYMSDVRRDPN